MFRNYLTVAIRNLLRHKTYSVINIAGLAIGMACCIVILLLVRHELSFDTFHEKGDRIYRIYLKASFGDKDIFTSNTYGPMGQALVEDYPEVVDFTRFFYTSWSGKFLVHYKGRRLFLEETKYAEPSFFKVFDFELASGDPKTALREPYSAVLTQDAAQKIFGNENPVGKVFQRDGKTSYTVTGVLKNMPKNSHLQFDMLLSITELINDPNHKINNWRSFDFPTYLLLDKGADSKSLEKKLPAFAKKYLDPGVLARVNLEFFLQPLADIHLHSSHINGEMNWYENDPAYVYGISLLAFIVLLIACFNFTNLSTSRSTGRAREVGIRKIVGAKRVQLIRQFLGESVLLAFCAMALAIALVELALPALNAFFGDVLVFDYFDNWKISLSLVGITIITGVLSGSYPAFFISAFRPVIALKGPQSSKTGKAAIKKTLVVAQFAVSVILLISTGVIIGQLQYIRDRDLGFNQDNIVTIPMDHISSHQIYESMRHKLLQNPAITGVAASHVKLGRKDGFSTNSFNFEGHSSEDPFTLKYLAVDYDFFSVYDLELVEGRAFSREFGTDAGSGRAYIINQAAAKEIGWERAVGKKVWQKKNSLADGQVIGVVKDFHFMSLHTEIGPFIMFINPGELSQMSVRIRPGNIAKTLDFLKATWGEYVPGCPFEYSFLDEHLANLYRSEERTATIVGVFSLLAIFVACLGLFGLISFSVQQRTKEIGIRKVLGASVPQVVVLLCREFMILFGIAILVAWPVVWYAMDHWLQDFAYRIELGPGLFVLGAVLAMIIALLTVSFQAVKAATANPVDALRYE